MPERLRAARAQSNSSSRPKGTSWTSDEEIGLLLQIAVERRQARDLRIPGRTISAIESKVNKLRRRGLSINMERPWIAAEDASLIDQAQAQHSLRFKLKNIAAPNRTPKAIKNRIQELRELGLLPRPETTKPRHVWTTSQVKTLRKAVLDRNGNLIRTAVQVVKTGTFPGLDKGSIYGAMANDEAIKAAIERRAKEKDNNRRQLRRFLNREGRNWPNVLLGQKFGYSAKVIAYFRETWKKPLNNPDQALAYPEVQRYWTLVNRKKCRDTRAA